MLRCVSVSVSVSVLVCIMVGASLSMCAAEQDVPQEVRQDIPGEMKLLKMQRRRLQIQLKILETYAHDTAILKEIQLVENPSDQDRIAYIDAIEDAMMDKEHATTSDLHIQKLKALGVGGVPVLIKNWDRWSSLKHTYLYDALLSLVDEEHLPILLENLYDQPAFAKILIHKKWHTRPQSREPLLRAVRTPFNMNINSFVSAIADWQDPTTYGDLLHALRHSPYSADSIAEILVDLPCEQMKPVLDELWLGMRHIDDRWTRHDFAQVALKFDNVEALGLIIHCLDNTENMHDIHIQRYQALLRPYIDDDISASDWGKWYERNKNDMTFDILSRRYSGKYGLSDEPSF